MTAPLANTVLDRAGATFGAFLPRLGACVALLVVGYLIAWVVARVLSKALQTVGFDAFAERIGVAQELTRFGLGSASKLLAGAIRLAILVIAVVAAISALGLTALTASLNAAVLFLPKLFAAALLLLAGLVLARIARQRIDHAATRMDLAGPLGLLTEIAIVAVFITTALAQLSVPLAFLTLMVAIVIGAISLAAALAFGLGSRDAARQIAAGRSISSSLRVGQTITVDERTGTIEAIEGAATVVRSGTSVFRIPNHVLLESVVEVHDDDEG